MVIFKKVIKGVSVMSDEKNVSKKDIEVINGDGSNLVMSPVYEHISAAKPKCKDKNPKNIIIPEGKKIKK
jgi:hypothetical protein